MYCFIKNKITSILLCKHFLFITFENPVFLYLLSGKIEIYTQGNPLECDEDLCWLTSMEHGVVVCMDNYPCQSPARWRDIPIHDMIIQLKKECGRYIFNYILQLTMIEEPIYFQHVTCSRKSTYTQGVIIINWMC